METLDKNFDYKLTERFAKGSARVFVKYEVEKLRMIHVNALRMCRRSKISKNYPMINQLRKVYEVYVKPYERENDQGDTGSSAQGDAADPAIETTETLPDPVTTTLRPTTVCLQQMPYSAETTTEETLDSEIASTTTPKRYQMPSEEALESAGNVQQPPKPQKRKVRRAKAKAKPKAKAKAAAKQMPPIKTKMNQQKSKGKSQNQD